MTVKTKVILTSEEIDWECITKGGDLYRICVPGGWIYRCDRDYYRRGVVFVPDPEVWVRKDLGTSLKP